MVVLSKYKKYWEEKASEHEMLKEELRKDALLAAGRLKDILIREFAVKKVVLFGSVLEKGCFQEDSEIDIAVEGLQKDMYFTALARLMSESIFDVDLKPLEDVRSLLKQRITKGKVLYKKRENS
jgi:predicted nucleotidyltransferase